MGRSWIPSAQEKQLMEKIEASHAQKKNIESCRACGELLDLIEKGYGSNKESPDAVSHLNSHDQMDRAMKMMCLADSLYRQHIDDAAAIAGVRCVETVKRISGSESNEILQPLFVLGWIYNDQENDARLKPTIEWQMRVMDKQPGAPIPMEASVWDEYAQLMRRQANIPEAQKYEKLARDLRAKNKMGPPEWNAQAKLLHKSGP